MVSKRNLCEQQVRLQVYEELRFRCRNEGDEAMIFFSTQKVLGGRRCGLNEKVIHPV